MHHDPRAVEVERIWRQRLDARLAEREMHDTQGKDRSASWLALKGLAWVVLGAVAVSVVLALAATMLGWGKS